MVFLNVPLGLFEWNPRLHTYIIVCPLMTLIMVSFAYCRRVSWLWMTLWATWATSREQLTKYEFSVLWLEGCIWSLCKIKTLYSNLLDDFIAFCQTNSLSLMSNCWIMNLDYCYKEGDTILYVFAFDKEGESFYIVGVEPWGKHWQAFNKLFEILLKYDKGYTKCLHTSLIVLLRQQFGNLFSPSLLYLNTHLDWSSNHQKKAYHAHTHNFLHHDISLFKAQVWVCFPNEGYNIQGERWGLGHVLQLDIHEYAIRK